MPVSLLFLSFASVPFICSSILHPPATVPGFYIDTLGDQDALKSSP